MVNTREEGGEKELSLSGMPKTAGGISSLGVHSATIGGLLYSGSEVRTLKSEEGPDSLKRGTTLLGVIWRLGKTVTRCADISSRGSPSHRLRNN